MKIGLDIRTLMEARYSGVSEYSYNLVKEILRLDPVNQYKLFYNSFRDISKHLPSFYLANVELVGKSYPNKIFNYLLQKFLVYPKIDQLLEVNLFFMPHLNFIALSPQSKSVLTVHDLSFLRYSEFFSWRKNFWHYMINVKQLVNNFTRIIAVSANTKNDLIKLLQVNPAKIKVIYSGVGEDYQPIKAGGFELAEVRKKYNLPTRFILYLGTLEPRKNVEGIIRAYSELRVASYELRDYKLVIAGGRGWRSSRIFSEWQESKYKEDIKFLGYVDKQDKVFLYNLATVFIYPSFYEGFGLPPLEAMACGLPVITSYSSSLPEVVGDAAILVDPYNITDIAQALNQVLSNQDLQDSLIIKGLARASQFKWGKSATEYLEVFRELAD